jgi:hypothetical protein
LLHAPRQLIGEAVANVSQADEFEYLSYPFLSRIVRPVVKREGHVGPNGLPGQQPGVLKYHPHLGASNVQHGRRVEAGDVHRTSIRLKESSEQE